MDKLYQLALRYTNNSLSKEDLIAEICGGAVQDWVGIFGVIVAIIAVLNNLNNIDTHAFQVPRNPVVPPHVDPLGWLSGKYDFRNSGHTPTYLKVTKPSTMPHAEFVGMSKEERRQLPHSYDMPINCEGHQKLNVGFWQSKFKVGDHGALHGLPYTLKKNGGTKTAKTDENALEMMRSIVDMPNRKNVQWFDNGTYQAGTDREFEAVHIYDLDNRIIAVFNKATGNFVTTCQLDRDEHNELLETHNFGGGKGWFSGQVKNLTPVTPVNSFESDVTGVTPINNSQDDNP